LLDVKKPGLLAGLFVGNCFYQVLLTETDRVKILGK
jgi:hypothetical protein